MRVSIVTNAFNQGKFLKCAIESVLQQDYPDIEYIVVNPGSTDDTAEILEEYGARLIVIDELDNGPADGLNKAFQRATGEIYGYLNADDFYFPGAISKAVGVFLDRPDADVVFADGHIVDVDGSYVRRQRSRTFSPLRYVYGLSFVLQQSTFYRAKAFKEIGGFNPDNRVTWDGELILQMALAGMRLVHIRAFWSAFRIHSQSITGSRRLAELSRETQVRYFFMVCGRRQLWVDKLALKFLRFVGRIVHPIDTLERMVDEINARR